MDSRKLNDLEYLLKMANEVRQGREKIENKGKSDLEIINSEYQFASAKLEKKSPSDETGRITVGAGAKAGA